MHQPTGEKEPSRPDVRRRGREPGGPRSNRFKVSFNDAELAILRAAAGRENQALASWVGHMSLAVAVERVVPVSADAGKVLRELIQTRGQLRRIGDDLEKVNAEGAASGAEIEDLLAVVRAAVQRVDEATVQVMRERQPRS